jgi:hypothetical protein
MKRSLRVTLALALFIAMLMSGMAALAEGEILTTSRIAENSAPIAKNLEFYTYRGVPIAGRFQATDPDGDPVTFCIEKTPKHGSVEVFEDFGFVYKPVGKKRTDSFTYVATDAVGNVSNEAKVTIEIKKQAISLNYSDMEGEQSYYAALRLAEEGVFIGEKLGNEYFFRPEETVSRGEFLAMCLNVCGVPALEGVGRTGFYDDEQMPSWAKPYVAAALMEGSISGYEDENGHIVFAPEVPITFAGAAVMMNNVLGVTDVATTAYSIDPDTCPVWAYQESVNLASCGIPVMYYDYPAAVTRADAAEMLCAAMDILEIRNSGGIFSWLE